MDFRDRVRAWAASALPAAWRDPAQDPATFEGHLARRREWDALAAAAGFVGLSWPTEYGGLGLGVVEEFIFYEEAARAGAPDMLNFIGFDLAGPAIIAYGTHEQKASLLPRILSGEDLWCEGFSEPGAGSDLAATSTRATFDPDRGVYVIEGQKIWTSLAQYADKCYLLVKTSTTERRHHNLSLLLVDMDQPGIEVRPIRQITDDHEFSEVFFQGAVAGPEQLLGQENGGWVLAGLTGLRRDRRIFDALRRYVVVRRLVDRLVAGASGRSGRELAADLEAEVELLNWHIRRCTEMSAAGLDTTSSSMILRLVWSELWQRVVAAGLAHAAADADSEAFWRREYLHARSVTIAGGTVQIQRNVIANRVLDLPRPRGAR